MDSVSEYNVINDPPLPDGWMKSVLINGDTIYHNKGATKITKNLPTQTENPVEIDNDTIRQAIKAALQKAEHEAATSNAKVAPAHAPAPAITLAPVAASTPVAAAAHAAPVAPAPAPPSVGVAQLFVKWKDKSGNNISARDQCQQIVDAVKCLVQKGYERVGLTYSANQKPQTQAIFGAYKFNPDLTNNNFDIGVAKTITETGISGANQAATLTQLDDLTDDAFRKVFRIIPLSTMEIGGGGEDVDEDALGKSYDCLEYVKQFLALDKSIILGWCDQYTEKELSLLKLSDTNPDELKNINKLVDDAYTLGGKVPTTKIQAKFTKVTDDKIVEYIDSNQSVVLTTATGKEYLPKRKKHINIGGDMAEKTKNTREIYIHAYLKFLVGRWNRDAQLLVNDCQSASPKAAPAAAHHAAHTPALIPIEKKPFADIIKDLEGQLTDASENDAEIKKLGITLPTDFLYPTDGDVSAKKNLNSAEPAIDVMITAFENSKDEGDKDFYLGACRSIEAAYVLEKGTNKDTSNEAMRAKLLLNLRKNSLLLKVPARWDYATMSLLKLEPPPTEINDLMRYSLEETIEYYSQDTGDEGTKFKELNIAEEPEMSWTFDTKSMGLKGKSGHATDVDKRFTKGFDNVLGVSCYFSTFLQLLLCDEDFLQLLIISICKPIEYDVSEKKFIIMKNLVDIFKLWFPIKNDNIQTITSNIRDNVTTILTELGMDTSQENDAREVYDAFIANIIEINDNVYIQKFVSNLEYNDNIVQNYQGISKPRSERNVKGYMLLIKPEITTSEDSKKINTSIQELINDNEKEKVDTNFTLSKDDFVPSSDEYKLYNLYNNITKRGILSTIRNICNVKNSDKITENSTKLTHLKTLNSFNTLGEDGSIDNVDYSYKNISSLLSNAEYKDIHTDINNIVALVNKKFTSDKKNTDFNLLDITDEICTSANKIYEFINSKLDTLSKPTKSQIKKTKNTINETHEYIVLDLNRTMSTGKNFMNVNIDPEVTICNKKYILRGYSFHIGDTIKSGHYAFVKCSSLGNPALVLNDYGIMNLNDIQTTASGGTRIVTSDELRQTGVSSLIYKKAGSQAGGGGGFKPRHNPITNHTASKSKHNSSFKVSSSKTKGKSRNRSHTQRVK